MISVNNKLFLRPYTSKGGLRAKNVSGGFATVGQKTNLVGLKAVAEGILKIGDGPIYGVNPGDMVYFPEEVLHSHEWAKKAFESDKIDGPFIIAEGVYAVGVVNEDK